MKQFDRKTLTCLIAVFGGNPRLFTAAIADEPSPTPSRHKLPPDFAKRIGEITDAVLEHHIDPPARQQMILGGVKSPVQGPGLPVPPGLSRRVSALSTPEQLATFLADIWPKSTAKSVDATKA